MLWIAGSMKVATVVTMGEPHVKFTGEIWVQLPDDLVARMWDVVRAVAAGHDSNFLMAEAQHLKDDIDKLLLFPVSLEDGRDD